MSQFQIQTERMQNGVAVVLVKGSRSARMERVVAALTGEKNAALAH